jgi:hypothetical protein
MIYLITGPIVIYTDTSNNNPGCGPDRDCDIKTIVGEV